MADLGPPSYLRGLDYCPSPLPPPPLISRSGSSTVMNWLTAISQYVTNEEGYTVETCLVNYVAI